MDDGFEGLSIYRYGAVEKVAGVAVMLRRAGVRPDTNQLTQNKYRGGAERYDAASVMAYSASATIPAAGDAGPGGPTPRPSLPTIFGTLWSSADMYPSRCTFHCPRTRDLSHPRRSREAKVPSTMV